MSRSAFRGWFACLNELVHIADWAYSNEQIYTHIATSRTWEYTLVRLEDNSAQPLLPSDDSYVITKTTDMIYTV